jgi:hypothetical protein
MEGRSITTVLATKTASTRSAALMVVIAAIVQRSVFRLNAVFLLTLHPTVGTTEGATPAVSPRSAAGMAPIAVGMAPTSRIARKDVLRTFAKIPVGSRSGATLIAT